MGQNWAIVVGINQYDTMRHLKYAERDAESMRNFFQESGFEQVYFFAQNAVIRGDNGVEMPAQPTGNRLRSFLRRRLADKPLGAGDTLWFFFAGHGKRRNERDYLMPIDADAGDAAVTGLAVRDLRELLQGSGAGNVILLVDACRDDGSRDGIGIGMEKQQGVITLFSCAPSELSYEIDELQAGAFTYALLQGLRIQGEGNCATVARLAEHVRVQVPYLVEQYRRTRQNPYLVAEPASKQNLILLPKQATPNDLLALKYAASQAENQGDRDLARDFWWRVSAISSSTDMEARQAIERLAGGNVGQRSNSTRNAGDSRSTGTTSLPPIISRRQMIQLGWGSLGSAGVVLVAQAWSDGQNQKPKSSASPIAPEIPSPNPVVSETTKPKSEEAEDSTRITLRDFEFETRKVSDQGELTKLETRQGKLFRQRIDSEVSLKMVQIPSGKFLMGSPESEQGRAKNEGPQHEVSVGKFFMAQTPITQAQWRSVAQLEKVKIDLNANPSKFKGDSRPVEQVSWWEAQEFCDRLSKSTGLSYRLPSEAEWEYACRSKTKTPFYFGETITTEVANYRGTDHEGWGQTPSGNYGNGPKGELLDHTSDVKDYPANAWGLYDMHGNVWEWCSDHWHASYDKAPIDGTAWLTDENEANRLIRGGSWNNFPQNCRSGYRSDEPPKNQDSGLGFRVVCVSA